MPVALHKRGADVNTGDNRPTVVTADDPGDDRIHTSR